MTDFALEAKKLRNKYKFFPFEMNLQTANEKIRKIITKLGGEVVVADLGDGSCRGGYGLIIETGKPIFPVSPYTVASADNSKLVHNIAHWLFHSDKQNHFNNGSDGNLDTEANQFRNEFLMPEEDIIYNIDKCKNFKYKFPVRQELIDSRVAAVMNRNGLTMF